MTGPAAPVPRGLPPKAHRVANCPAALRRSSHTDTGSETIEHLETSLSFLNRHSSFDHHHPASREPFLSVADSATNRSELPTTTSRLCNSSSAICKQMVSPVPSLTSPPPPFLNGGNAQGGSGAATAVESPSVANKPAAVLEFAEDFNGKATSGVTSPSMQQQILSPRFSITTIEGAAVEAVPAGSTVSDPIPVIYHRSSYVASPQTTMTGYQPASAPIHQHTSPPPSHAPQHAVPSITSATEPISDGMANVSLANTIDEDDGQCMHKSEPERIIELGGSSSRYGKLNVILGKGAYKVVYKALDREEGVEVAWNCLQSTKHEFNEFAQEIEILKKVRHSNIINFHESWFKDGEFVFITELMTYIHKLQSPSVKIIKRWARQVLKGLQYLHSHAPPIIHRDIKCDNIFINGSQGEVKIGDMGTAKMKFGKKYTVIGTPEFMAPEMYEEKGYSEKVDIYAFGMCVLEMVTGEYPYSECKNAAQIYKKGTKPECLARVEDPEILALINCCLAPEAERWPARKLVEHPFFTDDPEVSLISSTPKESYITFQIAFRGGVDRHAIKFDYHLDRDTIEDVVQEMIDEQVLSIRFKPYVVGELVKTLRDFARFKHTVPIIDPDAHCAHCHLGTCQGAVVNAGQGQTGGSVEPPRKPRTITRVHDPEPVAPPKKDDAVRRPSVCPEASAHDGLPIREYTNECPIDDFVADVAGQLGRDQEKAAEWISRLKPQDIQTVGDLRALQEGDWHQLGLTVFATRAFKNAMAVHKLLPRKIPSARSSEHAGSPGAGVVSPSTAAAVVAPVAAMIPGSVTSPRSEGTR